MRARGFLLGGTAGRTTLNGEGLQHEDGHSHVMAGTIPNVRDSSGTIGTMYRDKDLSRSRICSICTNAIVVDALRPSLPLWNVVNASERVSSLRGSACGWREGTKPPSCLRRSRRYRISGLFSEGR